MSSARGGSGGRKGRRSEASESQEHLGLRGLVQQRLLKDLFDAASAKFDGWKILVIDDSAMRVISSAIGMYDVMERRVTLVESLEKKRAPFPNMGVIYFVEASKESVNKIIEDFSGPKPLYGNQVFLFFMSRLPDQLFEQMKQCRPLIKRVKMLSEVNVDFLVKEERAFILDMKNSFQGFYLREGVAPAELTIADKLVTVCATLNEFPHIRYKESSAICTSLANVFNLKMDQFISQNPAWWYHGGPAKNNKQATRDRGVLLLLDRADDCLTPLMHDFHYQAMVHDLLNMDGDRITFDNENAEGKSEKKDVLLDEKDSVWVELRGCHIANVIETLSARIRDIMNSSTGNALGKKDGPQANMSLADMASALKALPEYKEIMSKLSQHMHLAHECMDTLKKDNLMELGELEQTFATGKDEEGQDAKLSEILETSERLLRDMADSAARVRLLLIIFVSQGGLKQQDKTRLMNAAQLDRDDSTILSALEVLGLSLVQEQEKKSGLGGMFGGDKVNALAKNDGNAEYAAARFISPFKTLLEDFVADELSMEEYPSVVPMPESSTASRKSKGGGKSVRSSASSARKSAGPSSRWSGASAGDKKAATNFTGGRCLVFMMGGLSFSEVSITREVMAKEQREIVVGSTNFIAAGDFIKDLKSLVSGNSAGSTRALSSDA